MVAGGIGLRPNTLVVGPKVHDALMHHPDVVDRVKHVTGLKQPQIGIDELGNYFGVQQYAVGYARAGTPGHFEALWGNHAVLAYTAMSSLAAAEGDMGEPGFGYTYRLNNYPIVEAPHFDKSTRSWLYPVTCEDTSVIAGKEAGYLFSNVVA